MNGDDDDARGLPRTGTALRRILGGLVIATLCFAALAVGTVHAWSRGVVFAASAIAALVAVARRLQTGKPLELTVPLVALAVAVAATALQLVPLPPAVLRVFSPAADELLSLRGYELHPLSLEPAATVAELAKLGAYLAFFAAASVYASRTYQRRQIIVAVAALATAIAVIGLAQAALGVREILGIYKPNAEWSPMVRGTFVNPNHFGALMCLGGPCAMVLALRERRLRTVAFAATFVINVAVILTVQRATIIAAVLGNVLVFALDLLQLRRGRELLSSRRFSRSLLALALIAAVGVAIGFGKHRLAPEAMRTFEGQDLRDPLSKVRVWEKSAELVWAHPWTGIGRGAFPQAFTRVSDVGGYTLYEWAENLYVQAVVDWGVPVALLLALLAAWSARLAVRRLREYPLALGPFCGLFALAVHEAADFAVELPGVALPALALLAALFGHRTPPATAPMHRARALWLLAPLALFAPFLIELRLPTARQDAAVLTAAVRDPRVPVDRVVALGDAARRRHPADYYVCALVAERLARELRPESLRWLNEAMYLNPTHPAPHLMAAELLASTGKKSQALLEYRRAAAGAPEPRSLVWTRVLARYPGIDDLLAATPETPAYRALLGKWLNSKGLYAEAERAYQLVVDEQPQHVRALAALVRLAITRHDAAAARRRLDLLLPLDRGTETRQLAIEERLLAGDVRSAAHLLDDGQQPPRVAFELELLVAHALAKAGHGAEARQRLDAVLHWDMPPEARMRLFETRAAVEKLAGNEQQYRWELEQRDRLRRD